MLTFLAILFFAVLAAGFLVVHLDIQSSKDFKYFGLTEKTRIAQDKYGFMDVKKNYIFSFGFLSAVAAVGVVAVIIGSAPALGIATIMLLIPTVLRFRAYRANVAKKPVKRRAQTEFLTRLKEHLSFEKPEVETVQLFNGMTVHTRGGVSYYELLGWIQSKKTDLQEALFELQSQIVELARKEPLNWFPK